MQLKPHDTVVALKYGCLALVSGQDSGEGSTVRTIAASLGLSPGEISKSNSRLLKAKLIASISSGRANRVRYQTVTSHMEEWLNFGIQYNIVPEPEGVGRGISTSWSNPEIKSRFVPRDFPHVWLFPGGDATGEGISPLYPNAPMAALGDRNLHIVLSLVDAVRLGKPRELAIARALISAHLSRIKDAQQFHFRES